MSRHAIGQDLATRLYALETAIDAALSEASELAAALPRARAQSYLSAVTGQKAFDQTAATLVALTSARGHAVQTHQTLAALARRLGLDDLAIGPLDKPEDSPPRTNEGPDMREMAIPHGDSPER